MGSDGTVRFTGTLRQDEGSSTTGVVIPPAVLEELGAGKRPPVRATLAGYEYRTTLGVMNGATMLSVSAAVREAAGIVAGDEIEVELIVDATPRDVDVPDDFALAMESAGVRAFFDGLANSLQRYHVDQVAGAKQPETRQRRIERAVGVFREGRKR